MSTTRARAETCRPACADPSGRRIHSWFRRSESGATAVEFGLIALPFLALLGGTFEHALAFWAQSNLEQAVYEASRDIYTGNFQTTNASTTNATQLLTAFKTKLCTLNNQPRRTLFNCSNVRVNVTVDDDFSDLSPMSPTQVNAQTGVASWNPAFGTSYACAKSTSAVMVQVAVDYPVFFKLLNPTAVTLPGNKRILQAASVFRVEPYDSKTVCQ